MSRGDRPDELQDRMRRAAKRRPGPKRAKKPAAGPSSRPARSGHRPARATDVALSPDTYDLLADFAVRAGVEIRAVAEALADQLDDDPLLAERVWVAVSGTDDGTPRDAADDRRHIPAPGGNWTRLPVIGIPVFTPALLPLKWSVSFLRAWLPSEPPTE